MFITQTLPALLGLGLFFTLPAAAQSASLAPDSPAEERRQSLRGPEHSRLVRDLLSYEVRNIRQFLASEVILRPKGYVYVLINHATLAAVNSGTYTVTYFDAQRQPLQTTTGRFGPMAPGGSRNELVSFPLPAGATHAELVVNNASAE